MSTHDLNSGVEVALESVERLAQLIITAGKAASNLYDKATRKPLDAEKFNDQVEIIRTNRAAFLAAVGRFNTAKTTRHAAILRRSTRTVSAEEGREYEILVTHFLIAVGNANRWIKHWIH